MSELDSDHNNINKLDHRISGSEQIARGIEEPRARDIKESPPTYNPRFPTVAIEADHIDDIHHGLTLLLDWGNRAYQAHAELLNDPTHPDNIRRRTAVQPGELELLEEYERAEEHLREFFDAAGERRFHDTIHRLHIRDHRPLRKLLLHLERRDEQLAAEYPQLKLARWFELQDSRADKSEYD